MPYRVMICDDSMVIRSAVARILEANPEITIVARVANGQAAVDAVARARPEIVVLDIEMPVMDGMIALPRLLAADPALRVIMSSTLTQRGADIALQALRLGAADYVPKPSASALAGDAGFGAELVAKVRGLGRMRRLGGVAATPAPVAASRPASAQTPLLLAIGSSTGGPNAPFTVVQGLRQNLPVPVVLTQHMPAGFTAMLAEHIGRLGILPCTEAQDGGALGAGRIWIAPGDRHLLVRRDGSRFYASLSDAPAENFCRPSVDPMLRSAAEAANGRVLVTMLTGMGQDGLAGTRTVVERGGMALAQDEATSVVWGMPGAIARAGLAHAVLPLPQLGPKILSLLGA